MTRTHDKALAGRRRLSEGELTILLDNHARHVAGKGGKKASLPFVDFSGLDLSGRNMSGADFTGSVFDGAKLTDAVLVGSNLSGCDLRGADIRRANLRKANLRGACLSGANLAGADLTEADIRPGKVAQPHPSRGFPAVVEEDRRGELHGALLIGATLERSQLDGVYAAGADFSDCSLAGAKLADANLKGADLSGAVLKDAQLGGANLEGADLEGVDMTGVSLAAARTVDAKLAGVLAAPTRDALARAETLARDVRNHDAWVNSGGAGGKLAKLDGEDLRPMGEALRGLKLTGMSARGACFLGLDMSGVQLQVGSSRVDLQACKLEYSIVSPK